MKPIEMLTTINFSEEEVDLLKESSRQLKVKFLPSRKAEDIPRDVWEKIEILYTDRVLPQPEWVPNLKWIQFQYAGIDFAFQHPLMKVSGITFTTQSGSSASQVAEYIVMMLLVLGHKLPEMIRHQSEKLWSPKRWDIFSPQELRGSTVGLIGYGSIARQTARLLQPFGVQILAVKRNVFQPQDRGYLLEGQGDPDGDFFTRLYPMQAIQSVLRECDFIVISLPLTSHTRHLIGADELSVCKPTAYIINASRGGIIDEDALLKALDENKLAGAALDVFQQEPLPAEHPIWTKANVLATPHIAGNSRFYNQRSIALFAENLNRYLSGEPLFNVYNPENEY